MEIEFFIFGSNSYIVCFIIESRKRYIGISIICCIINVIFLCKIMLIIFFLLISISKLIWVFFVFVDIFRLVVFICICIY